MMFEASVGKFVKCTGSTTLIPVPELNLSDRCELFQIVAKKRKRWCWQSPSYEPTPFCLDDLLCDEEDGLKLQPMVETTDEEFVQYNRTHQFSLKGKLGLKLKDFFDFEVHGSDSVDIEGKFGIVKKTSADIPTLSSLLPKRRLNLEHSLYHQIREHPRKTMALIVEKCYLQNGGEIIAKTNLSGDENITATDPQAGKLVEGDESTSITDDNSRDLKLFAGQQLAYSVCELLIRSDGSLDLVVDPDLSGGFIRADDMDVGDGDLKSSEPSVPDMFAPILDLDDNSRHIITESVQFMCSCPQDIVTSLSLIKQTYKMLNAEHFNIRKTSHVSVLHEKFVSPDRYWAPFTQLIGFCFLEDGSIEYPQQITPILNAILCLFEALDELEDEQLEKLAVIDQLAAKHLIYVLTQVLSNKKIHQDDPDLLPVLDPANKCLDLFLALGLSIDPDGHVTSVPDATLSLHSASRALYGLFWDRVYDEHTSHWCHIL